MNADTRPGRGEATPAQIAEHLRRCEGDFVPPLSERLDVDEYAQKIADRATRFEAWDGGTLVGLVAVYLNDPDREMAFITSVSVDREHQGTGVATTLLSTAIDSARREGFRHMALEVGRRNLAAVRLYTRAGFAMGAEPDGIVRMDLELQVSGSTGSEP